jgi:hypothetical protein
LAYAITRDGLSRAERGSRIRTVTPLSCAHNHTEPDVELATMRAPYSAIASASTAPRVERRLCRGRLTSVAELTEAINTWAEHWNIGAKPFIWKATTEDIIAEVQRGREALHQIRSATDH